jgi:DNA polymerase-1
MTYLFFERCIKRKDLSMVIIIDGNQLACRCYFAMTSKPTMDGSKNILTSSSGQRTETIYSFLTAFKSLVQNYKQDDTTVFLTWDGGNDRRKSFFPDYKAGRKKFEDAFYEQLDEIRKIVYYLGVKQYHFKAVEADDLIGTLTTKSRKKGQKVLIVSSDHDFEQLISRHVKVLHPLANNLLKDEQFVLDTYGVPPDRLVEVMSLTGDPTDNIPGIEKVGDKTAAKLILANSSLENLITNVDSLMSFNRKGEKVPANDNLKQKIKEGIEGIRIANKLVKICCDLDVEPDFSIQPIDFESLLQTFKKLDFSQFENDFYKWKECFSSHQGS